MASRPLRQAAQVPGWNRLRLADHLLIAGDNLEIVAAFSAGWLRGRRAASSESPASRRSWSGVQTMAASRNASGSLVHLSVGYAEAARAVNLKEKGAIGARR